MPFNGFKDFEDCTSQMMAKGHDADSAKKMCGAMQAKQEKQEQFVIEDGKEIIKNKKFSFCEKIEIAEAAGDSGKVRVSGVALYETTSRNGVTYVGNEIANQHGREGKVFMDHDTSSINAVGRWSFSYEGGKLIHNSEIMNTATHPDVVSMIKNKLIDRVSIGAMGDIVRVKKGEKEQFQVRNMEIMELSLVGIEGVPGAGIDTVISESFRPYDDQAKAVQIESKAVASARKYLIIRNRRQ